MSARQNYKRHEYTDRLVNWRAAWIETARPKQLPPAGDWKTWLILAGRGFGKTRIGAEDTGYFAASNANSRTAVIGPTQNDVRTVCFEGESGLINVIPKYFVKKYSSQDLELRLINGALIAGKSAEKPDRLRGPQWHRGWGDETASWGAAAGGVKNEGARLKETWDNFIFGLRLGEKPRVLLTTTPRPLDFLRQTVKNPRTVTTYGSTFENSANLAASAIETFKEIYEGTRKGQQELYGIILETNENALWKPSQLEALRVKELPEGVTLVRIVVACDPAVTAEEQSDETGIIVAGLGSDGHIYVLGDFSGQYSPNQWARELIAVYANTDADCIVGETNQGGDLVEANVRAEADGKFFRFKGVHAKRGKYLRAEPISAYYEKGKVHHIGTFPALENQMLNFIGSTAKGSPDRLDALVYAVGELMEGNVSHAFW